MLFPLRDQILCKILAILAQSPIVSFLLEFTFLLLPMRLFPCALVESYSLYLRTPELLFLKFSHYIFLFLSLLGIRFHFASSLIYCFLLLPSYVKLTSSCCSLASAFSVQGSIPIHLATVFLNIFTFFYLLLHLHHGVTLQSA